MWGKWCRGELLESLKARGKLVLVSSEARKKKVGDCCAAARRAPRAAQCTAASRWRVGVVDVMVGVYGDARSCMQRCDGWGVRSGYSGKTSVCE
jgi:hypothetical protein